MTGLSHGASESPVVRVAVDARDRVGAQRAERTVVDEFDRLAGEFRRADPASLMSRWTRDPSVATSSEFNELLAVALRWQELSNGVFNVSTHRLRQVWDHAALEKCRPSIGELHELATDIARAPYRFDGHRLRQVTPCGGIDLRAIISGYVLDSAVDAAWRLCDLGALTVWTNHHIRHRGSTPTHVPLERLSARLQRHVGTLTLTDGAVVVRAGGRSRNLFDPRTGHRALGTQTVIVVAPSATTAVAVATVLTILPVNEGYEFVEALNAPGSAVGGAANTAMTVGPVRCWWFDESGRDLGNAGT